MVVLEAIGLAAGEVFDYNRENFNFDNDQRLLKEKTRLQMQCERFRLFRADISDLVELTVSKMNMYHAVAALLLGSACTLYTEGRMHVPGNTPPWYIDIYFISIAGCFCYLILAVWLSMYASVASHSYGVRLRTRFVRLPIPSLAQLSAITAKFQQFESQGVSNILRVPFGPKGTNSWNVKGGDGPGADALRAAASSPVASPAARGRAPPTTAMADWLGAGEAAFGTPDILERAAEGGVGTHVKHFRRLQARWQCYDAYARVSMAIGINQLLQTMTYYVLGCTLIENRTISTAIALVVIYQSAALALCYLDIAGVSKRAIFVVQMVGAMPTLLVLLALAIAERGESGLLKPPAHSVLTPAAFFIEVIWYEALLWVASPSNDEASLPRKFRSVLFLDVFGDGSYDPTDAEHVLPPRRGTRRAQRHTQQQLQAASAERHVEAATAALRRWEACPANLMSQSQAKVLRKFREDLNICRKAFDDFTVEAKAKRGVYHHDQAWLQEHGNRAWANLSAFEREHEPFAGALMGPFDCKGRQTFYDLEAKSSVYNDVKGRDLLTLRMVAELVRKTEIVVQSVCSTMEDDDSDSDASVASPRSAVSRGGHRRHRSVPPIKVERLPWKILRRMTRCFQLCWLFLGIMNILYVKGMGFDTMRLDQDGVVEGLGGFYPAVVATDAGSQAQILGETAEDAHGAAPAEDAHGGAPVADAHGGAPAADAHGGAPAADAHGAAPVADAHGAAPAPDAHGAAPAADAHGAAAAPDAHGAAPAPDAHGADAHSAAPAAGHARRLRDAPRRQGRPPRVLQLQALDVAWPFGEHFRPRSLSWLRNASSVGGELVVGSPYAMYRGSAVGGGRRLSLRALPRSTFPRGARVFCASAGQPCIAAALVPEGVAVWQLDREEEGPVERVALPLRGAAWTLLAGAVVPCASVRRLVASAGAASVCLLLAGWADGRVPLVATELPSGPAARPPLRSRADAPLLGARDCRSPGPCGAAVVALHIDAATLRLWALLDDAQVQAWDLSASRHLGSWALRWPKEAGNVTAAALCELPHVSSTADEIGSGGALLLAGTSDKLGPQLWRAMSSLSLPQETSLSPGSLRKS